MKHFIPAALLVAVAATTFSGSSANAQTTPPNVCPEPKTIVGICNKKVGGSCWQGKWYVADHQIAAKNQCVLEMSRAKR
jgi:hypothetical protein